MRRNRCFLIAMTIFLSMTIFQVAADTGEKRADSIVISINPLGFLTGYIGGGIEVRLSEWISFYALPSYYKFSLTAFSRLFPDTEVWSVNSSIGCNFFFEKTALVGSFFGIGIVGGYMSVSDSVLTRAGPYMGIEIRIGTRIAMGKNFTIAPQTSLRYVAALFNVDGMGEDAVRVAQAQRHRMGINPGILF